MQRDKIQMVCQRFSNAIPGAGLLLVPPCYGHVTYERLLAWPRPRNKLLQLRLKRSVRTRDQSPDFKSASLLLRLITGCEENARARRE